jgi:spore coat polysaccharide biosynthesis protein SpsF
VLLPLAGMPVAILAARRAMNTGIPLVVATSVEPDDDGLAEELHAAGLAVHRGSLEDTLARVVEALSGHDDGTPVIRLTADNVFPDGRLLEELLTDFAGRGLDYLRCNGEPSGLPYGMSAEVTRLGHLREAEAKAEAASDREHVTPYVARKFGVAYFEKYKALGKGHYRCTIDSYDDYIEARRVFRDEPRPVAVSAMDLVGRLEGGRYQPWGRSAVSRLVVGGAQLGMRYGIANTAGRPERAAATAILKSAIGNGATDIDTARAYGSSEAVIGSALSGGWADRARVVTKLSPLDGCGADASAQLVSARIEASIDASCVRLKRDALDVLLLHRASHLHAWGGLAWRRLVELREEGRARAIGVSVQGPEELEAALDVEGIEFIQLPFNILDWRWLDIIPKLQATRSERRVHVHARSALLQGLLCTRDESAWRRAHVPAPENAWAWLDARALEFGRKDVPDLCLAYARAQPWIDGVVVGMETIEQLAANVDYFNTPTLTIEQAGDVDAGRPRFGVETLDPSHWLGERS